MTKDRANTSDRAEKAEVRAPTLVIARMIAAELGRASNGDQEVVDKGPRRHQFLLENLEGTEF